MNMQTAEFQLRYGGEDVKKLKGLLKIKQPLALIEELPTSEDDPIRRLKWALPTDAPYRDVCFNEWKNFCECAKSAWGSAAEEDLCDVQFFVIDQSGKRLGGLVWFEGRHHVDEYALHCGDSLDLLMPDGSWLKGRYEVEHGKSGIIPMFYLSLYGSHAAFPITEYMIFKR